MKNDTHIAPFRPRATLTMLLIMLAGFAMRMYRLDAQSLWLDELGQASVASPGLTSAIQGAQIHAGAAPLDYVLTWLALLVARADFVVRLPAAFSGTLTIAILYQLGRRLFGSRVGTLAALLLAFAPLHLRYSQEVRFYSLFTCLAIASTLVLVVAMRRNRRTAWLLYALVLTAALYSHYYTALVVVAHAVTVAASELWPEKFLSLASMPSHSQIKRFHRLRSFVLSAAAAAIAFLPWLITTVVDEVGSDWIEPPIFDLAFLRDMLAGGVYGESMADPPWGLWLFAGLAVIGATMAWRQPQKRFGALLGLSITVLSPPLIVLGLTQVNYFFLPKQILFILPFFMLLVAQGTLATVRWATGAIGIRKSLAVDLAMGLAAVALVALLIPGIRAVRGEVRQNWRDALAFVTANAGPNDVLAIPHLGDSFFIYYSPELADRAIAVASVDHMAQIAATHPALWVPMIPHTIRTGPDIVAWLESSDALPLTFGALALYYLEPGRSAREIMPEVVQWEPPRNWRAAQGLANAFQEADMIVEASHALDLAANLAQDSQTESQIRLRQGVFWQQQGDNGRAIEAFRLSVALWERNVAARLSLTRLLLTEGAFDEAGSLAEPVLSWEPDNARALRLLSEARWAQDRHAEAVELLQNALALDPADAASWFRLGNMLVGLEDNRAAIGAYQRYLDLEEDGTHAATVRETLERLQAGSESPGLE